MQELIVMVKWPRYEQERVYQQQVCMSRCETIDVACSIDIVDYSSIFY